jgi:hypothetical protein
MPMARITSQCVQINTFSKLHDACAVTAGTSELIHNPGCLHEVGTTG